MTISIADRLLKSETGLSETARRVLSQIDGGTKWLRSAMADPKADHRFSDEPALIAAVAKAVRGSQPGPSSEISS